MTADLADLVSVRYLVHDVEAAIFRPRQNIFRILQIHRENRGGKTELKI